MGAGLKDQLVDSSKIIGEMVAGNVGEDPCLYADIFEMVLNEPMPMSSRAGRVLNICTEKNHDLFLPYIGKTIDALRKGKEIHRCLLKIFAETEYPLNEEQEGILVDYCFSLLADESQSIANKIYSMDILERFARKEPDIIPELKSVIEEIIPFGSAGVKNRAGKVLKRLNKKSKGS